MRKTLVYDWPLRIFHWLFAGLFLGSFIIAKTLDDESVVFSFHMLFGLMMGALVIWRLIWGFVGSKYSRFSSFNLHPIDLKNYFLGILNGSKKRWSGHNPASSWAALIFFGLALGLVGTGYLMSQGGKESFEDVHELLSHAFLVVVILHIAGVILHSLRHRDLIALSLLDGKKEIMSTDVETGAKGEGISSSRPFSGIFLLVFFCLGGFYLFNQFDFQTRNLKIFGQTLQLGESETSYGIDQESVFKEKNRRHKKDHDEDGEESWEK